MKKNLGQHYSELAKRNLRRLKEDSHWTVPQMAMQLELSESYVGKLISLKSDKVPSIYLLGQICEKANVTIDYFFEEC